MEKSKHENLDETVEKSSVIINKQSKEIENDSDSSNRSKRESSECENLKIGPIEEKIECEGKQNFGSNINNDLQSKEFSTPTISSESKQKSLKTSSNLEKSFDVSISTTRISTINRIQENLTWSMESDRRSFRCTDDDNNQRENRMEEISADSNEDLQSNKFYAEQKENR